jgi:hypothetical protein
VREGKLKPHRKGRKGIHYQKPIHQEREDNAKRDIGDTIGMLIHMNLLRQRKRTFRRR